MLKVVFRIIKDTVVSFAFEFVWIVFIIELSAKLASDFFIFFPASIFALGLLGLLVFLKPNILSVITACIVYFFIFSYLKPIFRDGFHAWEMTGDDWGGMLMHSFFWSVSLALQIIALAVGRFFRKYKINIQKK